MASRWLALIAGTWLAGCGGGHTTSEVLFSRLDARTTGVEFANVLVREDHFNILDYLYFYDGGGVAIGDINNDRLPDLFLTGNQVSNRLYLNQGQMRFRDVTEEAGVASADSIWSTGVTMADVNGDGWLDIYVCNVSHLTKSGHNFLFINQQNGTFTEESRRYGLDFVGLSTQAAFLDYDLDGDLDMYLLNHAIHTRESFVPAWRRIIDAPRVGDKLYRQDDGFFVSVSAEAGIYSSALGYGLGLAISDIDEDGWPDIYVGNDFHENDYLYLNGGRGTFSERLQDVIGHTSRSTMGVDLADLNNDARPDIVALDMLPSDLSAYRTATGPYGDALAKIKADFGYGPQVARNTLQLHRGYGPDGLPLFSEIGAYAGIQATDWSWAPLAADFDGDGWKDLFATNGIPGRPNDLDYIEYVARPEVQRLLALGSPDDQKAIEARMPTVQIPNYAFRGGPDLIFTDVTRQWGLHEAGISNGAAYGDLDLDGDLDLVTNNIDDRAFIYLNNSTAGHISVKLVGNVPNTSGIGAKVHVWAGGLNQFQEHYPTRGFQSSMDHVMSFGLGSAAHADSVRVIWPRGGVQTLHQVSAGTRLELSEADAAHLNLYNTPVRTPLVAAVSGDLDYVHRENPYEDFEVLPLLPHKLSRQGPAMAIADLNGDRLHDVYLGGAHGQAGQIFLQGDGGAFELGYTFEEYSDHEEVDAALFDADGDGDYDLYVVHGGWQETDAFLQDRLHLNQGNAAFVAAPLPVFESNGCCVAAADYDRDGDVDLFVGSRSMARSYGQAPRSYLLENNGAGQYSIADVPALEAAGMITGATWADVTGDSGPDLVLVGEWMPITVLENANGRLRNVTDSLGLAQTGGLWQSLLAEDVDDDGDVDLLAGNLGTNSIFAPPLRLYALDFDQNGHIDPLLAERKGEDWYSWALRDALVRQMPGLANILPTNHSYSDKTVRDLFGDEALANAEVANVEVLASSLLINESRRGFSTFALPDLVQWAPVMAIEIADPDADGQPEFFVAGNLLGTNDVQGPYDASFGHVLRYADSGRFESVMDSGFLVRGEVRRLGTVPGKRLRILVARNNASALIYAAQAGPK